MANIEIGKVYRCIDGIYTRDTHVLVLNTGRGNRYRVRIVKVLPSADRKGSAELGDDWDVHDGWLISNSNKGSLNPNHAFILAGKGTKK